MKLVLLFFVICFASLSVYADPNLIEKGFLTEAGFTDPSNAHQNTLRSAGIVPSADCPACAFAQQLGAHELNAVELGAEPGTYGQIPANSTDPAKEQK